jgi:hypothetical protein
VTARWSAAVAAVLLVLAAVFGAHLAAVLLLAAVTVICAALVALSAGIAGAVVESGWRTVPGCPVLSMWEEA